MATTGRRRCVKRKGAVGRVPGWEMGRDFGLGSKLVCSEKLGKKSLETQRRSEISEDGELFYFD